MFIIHSDELAWEVDLNKARQATQYANTVLMREGGSIPVVGDFQRHLGLETVLMGFSSPDAQIHAPNERFYLPNYYRGIETVIRFLHEYAARF